jgi:hypothetical protein
MNSFKKYKRFFAFGCSMTAYRWPTWADIISQEISESYNFGQSGGGNLFIASQVAEVNQKYKFNENDLVMIMWSSVTREDRYVNRQWLTPGNIYTQNYYDNEFIKKFVDLRGCLIRDLSMVALTKHLLDNINVDYEMLQMSPFRYSQFSDPTMRFSPEHDVFELYNELVESIHKDILTVEFNGNWPQHPISDAGGQTADYHPSPQSHLNYLNKIFPKISWSDCTMNFVNEHDKIVKDARTFSDLCWNPQRPSRVL